MDGIHDLSSSLHGISSAAALSEETDQADDFLTRLLRLVDGDDVDDDAPPAPLSEETDQADDFLTRLLRLVDDDDVDDDAFRAIVSSIQTIHQKVRYVVGASDILKTTVVERNEDGDKCSICLEEFEVGKEATITECSHVFHEDCLVSWLKRKVTCPYCRSNLLKGRQRLCT